MLSADTVRCRMLCALEWAVYERSNGNIVQTKPKRGAYTKIWTCVVINLRAGTELWKDLQGEPYSYQPNDGEESVGTLSGE